MSRPGFAKGFTREGSYVPDNLIAGEFPRICRVVTVTGGADLPAGAVLGRINANNFYQLSAAAATDGSETPDVILAAPVEASAGDVQAHAYFTGEFNADALSFGIGHTLASIAAAFRTRSLFLRNVQP